MVTPGSKLGHYSVGVKVRACLAGAEDMLRQSRRLLNEMPTEQAEAWIAELFETEEKLSKMRTDVQSAARALHEKECAQ